MAIFTRGILGPFSGKVGAIVGATWKGKSVLRSAPKKSTKPPSALQLLSRKEFQVTERFLNPLSAWIDMSYSIDPPDMTKRNLAPSYHKKHALLITGDMVAIDYPKALVSMGELRAIDVTAASITGENALALSWVDNSNEGLADPGDLLLVVLYAPATHQYYFSQDAATRQDGSVVLPLPASFSGLELHCWAGFRDAVTGITADSRYVFLG
jgi:hypothetical protein|tara:strand:+ start:81595 stop:82227 length:633 start_codon:yes stop_codon:yes gene_type:complete